jgi:hypothetical protein
MVGQSAVFWANYQVAPIALTIAMWREKKEMVPRKRDHANKTLFV